MNSLRRFWFIFAQICALLVLALAALFVLEHLYPGRLPIPSSRPGVTIAELSHLPRVQAPGSYAEAALRAQPAVVSISTFQSNHSHAEGFPSLFRTPSSGSRAGLGSGVIVSANGYLLTNHHVIRGADKIGVVLPDGRKLPARLIGSDPETDLAVLHIEVSGLPSITFAENDSLKVGDVVLALGNPFGVGQTVTMGIVSALNRTGLGINTFERFIQTDAAINPGNSGGALVDTAGRLVGINAVIYSQSGGNEGIGFAIPISLARNIMQQIVTQGGVTRGWIGVTLAEITPEVAEALHLNRREGVLIEGVYANGPAARAGMRPGDVLTGLNSRIMQNTRTLLDQVAAMQPGQVATLEIWREGRRLQFSVQVGKRPQPSTEE